MEIVVVGGLLVAVVGVLMLVAPDIFWALQERTNATRGQVSERTERWDQGNRLGGVLVLVVGVALVVVGLGIR